jgi:Pectate lyase superfamily protein
MSSTFDRDPQPRIQYVGDGERTTFPFPFVVLNGDDLLVYANGNLATGFAITGLGEESGGEITFANAPAPGTSMTLLRRTEGIRETDFVDGAPFRAAAINAELDRIMMLIQEDREEHGRSLRGLPAEGGLDFCLPGASERANRVLGFDSAGQPVAFGLTEIPDSGDASGLMVTPEGASTARALGEHLATIVNVRDFGAKGDGVTDDNAAFEAALTAAAGRNSPVYVPASANAYVLGAGLTVDGMSLVGDGAGSTLKVGQASGFGLQVTGAGARLADLRVLGPAANVWPIAASEVDLTTTSLDGIFVANGAVGATLENVAVAGCHSGLAIEGGMQGITGCAFSFNRNGIEIRAGAGRSIFAAGSQLHGCSRGLRVDGAAPIEQLSVQGGSVTACGIAFELVQPSEGWRSVDIEGLSFAHSLSTSVQAGPRQSVGVRGCAHDASGKRSGASIRLLAQGATVEAPNLIAENNRAEATRVVSVQLSGGSNLNLLQPGDLVVLSADADDLDDLWTALKATRAGIVHKVLSQTTSTAQIELASAAGTPLLVGADTLRVVGRSGTAVVDSVGASAPTASFLWLRADDHCRIFAAHNPISKQQIEIGGASAEVHHLPGLGGQATSVGDVELSQGKINGAFARLLTFEIAQDTAISFAPDSPIGMVQAFGHGSLGDPIVAVFSYRADALGYTQLVVGDGNFVAAAQRTALNGTTGGAGKFTYSAHTNGQIYVENRLAGPPRKVSLYVIGAPL